MLHQLWGNRKYTEQLINANSWTIMINFLTINFYPGLPLGVTAWCIFCTYKLEASPGWLNKITSSWGNDASRLGLAAAAGACASIVIQIVLFFFPAFRSSSASVPLTVFFSFFFTTWLQINNNNKKYNIYIYSRRHPQVNLSRIKKHWRGSLLFFFWKKSC